VSEAEPGFFPVRRPDPGVMMHAIDRLRPPPFATFVAEHRRA
jgi:hypothetical protein